MRTPTPSIDYTSRDYAAYKADMIQHLQAVMPEYTDTSETDAGIVIIEGTANALDSISLYNDIVANDVILPTTQSRSMAVLIAQALGYIPYNQTASEYPQVFVLTAARNIATLIPKGTVVKTKADVDLATIYYVTNDDLVIPAGALGDEKDSNDEYIYTVPLVAGRVINQDVIGSSNGAPLQSFMLNYSGVIVDSLEVFVNEGSGFDLWTRVDSFFDSDENSMTYMVTVDDFNRCSIIFGNGVKGKIPTIYTNGIIANYRIGGGEASNVPAGVINTLETGIAFVDSTFNLDISVRGHDKEELESIKINAPAKYRSRDRLVTLQDYKDLLRINFYDFLDVQAVKDEFNNRKVHLYYMMRSGYSYTTALSDAVDNYIDGHSMLGDITYDISSYIADTVNISAKLYYDKDYDVTQLVADIKYYVQNVIFAYGNQVFNTSIVKSDLEAKIKSTFSGIMSFRINSPVADIISPQDKQYVLTIGTITITSEAI